MAVVVFNPVAFLARYPEFSAVNTNTLQAYFNEATFYLSNSDSSIVSDPVRRAVYLNMITAHIAFINGALSADGQTRPVGRVSSASEGSVSASFENYPQTAGSGAWFQQSQYGAAFWQATSALRGFQYRPCPTIY